MPPQAPEPIINRCPECEQKIDVTELSPFAKISCPHCGETIRVRTSLGTFHLTRLLGEGGMSQVFLATDSTLNREVALKVLHRNLTEDDALISMFEREAKLTASINHSNVVRVYTVGKAQGYFFIAMELVDNVSLEEKIGGQGPVRENEVLEIAYDVSLGLRAAFKAGLIHRDIKPGNVLLTRDGSAKLVDFGLALAHGGEDEVEEVWATPFYVPPEKLDGEPDDFRGDIYSLGAALFHALAGSPPFEANTASMQELKEIKAQPLHLRDAAPHASPKVAKLIDKMMAYDPAGRHQSYDELVDEIAELLEETSGGGGSRGGRKVPDRPGAKKRNTQLAAIGIPLVAIGLGVGMYYAFSDRGDDDVTPPIISGGGERVMGGANTGSEFRAAREKLVASEFEASYNQFSKLLETPENLKQTTRSWTRFNTGLSLLFRGDEKGARLLFAALVTEEGYPDDEKSQREKVFFEKVGRLAAEPLPVMDDAKSEFDSSTMECVGLLVCGLKNWSSGQFDSGARFLTAFVGATPPSDPDYAWIPKYQGLIGPYLDDLEVVRGLPRPERNLTPAQLDEMQKKLTLSLAAFKTEGAAPTLARSRLERAKLFLAEPAPSVTVAGTPGGNGTSGTPGGTTGPGTTPPPGGTPGTGEPGAEAEEMKIVGTIRTNAAPMIDQYRFVDAARQWEATEFGTSRAVKNAQLEGMICMRSEEFVRDLMEFLARGEFDGIVQRREGVPLEAKITAADRETMIIDLGFGPNRLAVAELDPAWMLKTARETLLAGPSATAEMRPEAWMKAVWFARTTGLASEAREMAGEVALFNESFRNTWDFLHNEGQGQGGN